MGKLRISPEVEQLIRSDLEHRIEKIVSLTFKLAKKKFLKESRAYQLFGYDFILDVKGIPWLSDIKKAPYFAPNQKEELETILKHQLAILSHRRSQMVTYLKNLREKVEEFITSEKISLKSENSFLKTFHDRFNPVRIRNGLLKVMQSMPDLEAPEGFREIYREKAGYGNEFDTLAEGSAKLEFHRVEYGNDYEDLLDIIMKNDL